MADMSTMNIMTIMDRTKAMSITVITAITDRMRDMNITVITAIIHTIAPQTDLQTAM